MEEQSLILTFVTIAIALGISTYLIRRYELSRKQVLLFIVLVLFWSSVIVIRAYRKSFVIQPIEMGGLALGAMAAANVASAYGLMSFLLRFPSMFLADLLKSKRMMFLLTTLLLTASSLVVVFWPSYKSLYVSSAALGLGASMLALFNVSFSESFSPEQAMKSVSILSAAPLLAEFLVAPLQYLATGFGNRYPLLWSMSAVLSFIAFVVILFIKEDKRPKRTMTRGSFMYVIKTRNIWLYGIIGIIISLLRFSLTGSNLITYVQSELINMEPIMVAYLDLIFALFQLVAGVLAGLYFAKRIGLKYTLFTGLLLSTLYNTILLVTKEPTILFICYSLSGFGYGLTYNTLIGLALETYPKEHRDMSMGLFQTMFAIGIFYGDKIYNIIRGFVDQRVGDVNQEVFLVMLILSILTGIILLLFLPRIRKERSLS